MSLNEQQTKAITPVAEQGQPSVPVLVTSLITWEHDAVGIDVEQLASDVYEISEHGPVFIQEAYTGSDFRAIIISNHELEPDVLESEFMRHWTSDE